MQEVSAVLLQRASNGSSGLVQEKSRQAWAALLGSVAVWERTEYPVVGPVSGNEWNLYYLPILIPRWTTINCLGFLVSDLKTYIHFILDVFTVCICYFKDELINLPFSFFPWLNLKTIFLNNRFGMKWMSRYNLRYSGTAAFWKWFLWRYIMDKTGLNSSQRFSDKNPGTKIFFACFCEVPFFNIQAGMNELPNFKTPATMAMKNGFDRLLA